MYATVVHISLQCFIFLYLIKMFVFFVSSSLKYFGDGESRRWVSQMMLSPLQRINPYVTFIM